MMNIKIIENFCERFPEDKTYYKPGVYNTIVFTNENGNLDSHLTSAQFHGCPTIIGEMSRADIVKMLIQHFK